MVKTCIMVIHTGYKHNHVTNIQLEGEENIKNMVLSLTTEVGRIHLNLVAAQLTPYNMTVMTEESWYYPKQLRVAGYTSTL